MKPILVRDHVLEIREISHDELDVVLNVYWQCEDFLTLGPVATASMEMVLKDMEVSQEEGGIFCGILISDREMIGVVDFVPSQYRGDPQTAYLSLLMIAKPFRSQGIGGSILKAVEEEIQKDANVKAILAGVQVNNPRAVKFWQKHGYQIVSGPDHMPDQTIVFGLRKELSK